MENGGEPVKSISKTNFDDTSIAFAHKNNLALRKTFFLFSMMNKPALVKLGTSLITFSLNIHLPVKKLIKKTLFNQFCGGENIEDCNNTMRNLSNAGVGTILDYAVEGATTEKGFDTTEKETIENILNAKDAKEIPFCVFKPTGLGPNTVLEKLHLKRPLNSDEQAAYDRMYKRFKNICQTAYDNNVRIFIDAEETWFQDPLDEIVYQMMKMYNQERAIVYNTYQLYCKNKLAKLKEANERALSKGYKLGAKLVRGAYMEKERDRAQKMGYEDPIQPNKAATDEDFNKAILYCMENVGQIAFCCGTHNEKSSYYLIDLIEEFGQDPTNKDIFFAQLFGMSDHISFNLSNAGFNVAKYVPYGPVEAVLPYLFRRAEENTAISGQSSREYNLLKKEIARRKA
ncbi:MAG: proline dehydrogenase [Thalassobius sp.]|nr:proline dehydrogenase [Thalassovita sp.]